MKLKKKNNYLQFLSWCATINSLKNTPEAERNATEGRHGRMSTDRVSTIKLTRGVKKLKRNDIQLLPKEVVKTLLGPLGEPKKIMAAAKR